jgi:hypothetical protein
MNIFTAVEDIHSDVAKFLYRNIGSVATLWAVINVKMHLTGAGQEQASDNPTIDERADDDNVATDAAENEANREEQGYATKMAPLHKAELCGVIRRHAYHELLALGVEPPPQRKGEDAGEYRARVETWKQFNLPSTYHNQIAFFCDPKSGKPNQATIDSFGRLVAAGTLSQKEADQAIAADRERQAKQWQGLENELADTIGSFDAETEDGETAFDLLQPDFGIRLYDDVIRRTKGDVKRFVKNVALGKLTGMGIDAAEAEGIHELYSKELDRFAKARAQYYKAHAGELDQQAAA